MNSAVLTNQNLEQIKSIIAVKFGMDLTLQQLQSLLEAQTEELKKELLEATVDPTSLDLLIESISEAITGMHYPTAASTSYFKEYYQKILIENRDDFFSKP